LKMPILHTCHAHNSCIWSWPVWCPRRRLCRRWHFACCTMRAL